MVGLVSAEVVEEFSVGIQVVAAGKMEAGVEGTMVSAGVEGTVVSAGVEGTLAAVVEPISLVVVETGEEEDLVGLAVGVGLTRAAVTVMTVWIHGIVITTLEASGREIEAGVTAGVIVLVLTEFEHGTTTEAVAAVAAEAGLAVAAAAGATAMTNMRDLMGGKLS